MVSKKAVQETLSNIIIRLINPSDCMRSQVTGQGVCVCVCEMTSRCPEASALLIGGEGLCPLY